MGRGIIDQHPRTRRQAVVDLHRNLARAVKLLARHAEHREAGIDIVACLQRTQDLAKDCAGPPPKDDPEEED